MFLEKINRPCLLTKHSRVIHEKYKKNPGKPGFFMPTKMNQVPTPVFDLEQGAVF
jgi:hypothetical protein